MTSAILVQILSFSTFNLNYLETLEKITEADGQKIIYTILFSTIYTTFFFVLAGFIVCGFTSSKIQVKKRPNQGVYQSLVNATIIGMIFAILSGTINGLFYGLVYQLSLEKILLLGIIMGFPHGLMGALLSGGMSLLQHFTLRLLLWQDGSIPWNYVHFLDYATNRLFLQKVGGGYRFIHKLLQDHFAQIEFERK